MGRANEGVVLSRNSKRRSPFFNHSHPPSLSSSIVFPPFLFAPLSLSSPFSIRFYPLFLVSTLSCHVTSYILFHPRVAHCSSLLRFFFFVLSFPGRGRTRSIQGNRIEFPPMHSRRKSFPRLVAPLFYRPGQDGSGW